MRAYYNEFDKFAAQWLRNLIEAGEIAPGVVDERDIWDVAPTDLAGYDRCHFFAGIAGWDAALKLAGWPDEWPVWTGSCPCQPFSAAGKRGKGSDERHLWPAWFWLIQQCKPPIIFGEQVASKDGLKWLDLVCSDLEAEGYAVGAADLPAAGVGAPHIRQRLFFVGYTPERRSWAGLRHTGQAGFGWVQPSDPSPTGLVADAGSDAITTVTEGIPKCQIDKQELGGRRIGNSRQDAGELADAEQPANRSQTQSPNHLTSETNGPTNRISRCGNSFNPWSSLLWLPCRDGKFRPTIANIYPLVDGSAFRVGSGSPLEGKSRVGMLRAAGNAIVPQVAAEFIKAVMEVI